MTFQSNYGLNKYRQEDAGQFTGVNPLTDLSTSFSRGLGDIGATNQEVSTSYGEQGVAGYGKWQAAKQVADDYRRQVDASKRRGLLGGLLGLGSTIASFIPGGQAVGIALGAGAQAAQRFG